VIFYSKKMVKQRDRLIIVEISQGKDGFPLTPAGMTTLERIPALGAAEFLAKYGSLANLFERSELFATMIWPGAKEPQRGRSQAEMVLGPFPKRKGPRLPGRNPASIVHSHHLQ